MKQVARSTTTRQELLLAIENSANNPDIMNNLNDYIVA